MSKNRQRQKQRQRQPIRRPRGPIERPRRPRRPTVVRMLPPVPGTPPFNPYGRARKRRNRAPALQKRLRESVPAPVPPPITPKAKGPSERPQASWRQWFLVWVLVALLPAPALYATGYPVIDISNLIENIRQALNTATQIYNQVEQIQTMYQNLERVADPNWRDLSGLFEELNARAQQGESLAYSLPGVFGTYKTRLPGYVVMEPDQFENVYKAWTDLALDTFAATLDTASTQAQEYEETQAQLAELAAIANGVGGNVQAQQVSAMIEGHMAQEVARLNQLLAALLNAQTVHYGHETTLRANAEATLQWMIDESKRPWVPYDGTKGLKPVPDGWPWGAV